MLNLNSNKYIDKFQHIEGGGEGGYFTCVSDKLSDLASSFLSCPTTYWFFSNACSSFKSWEGEKAVRIRLGLRKGNKNSGKLGPENQD